MQAFGDESLRNAGHRVARNNALSLANEANRRPEGVTSMSLEEAEKFAAEADKLDADLDYLEAATTVGGEGPVVEDSPNVLKEVKAIKKKKATRKMKAKAKLAGAQPEAKAKPEVTDVVCSFSSLIVVIAVILSISTCLSNFYV